jgi:hypothetical protein
MKMMPKRKTALLAVALMVVLAGGVYAGMLLSNHLTASWNVVNTNTELLLSWNPSPDGSSFARGVWYGNYGVRLQNTGTATYHVLVYFHINAGADLPTNCIKIQYWDGSAWLDLPLTGWGTSQLSGYFGPLGGFDCTKGWDVTTLLQVMFDGTAPITGYNTDIWVEQV